jgi:hypothetical protein
MTPILCLIAACMIAEESARRCDADPESMTLIERPITLADTADLPRSRIATPEHRACKRIADELILPANHRIVSVSIERARAPELQDARR